MVSWAKQLERALAPSVVLVVAGCSGVGEPGDGFEDVDIEHGAIIGGTPIADSDSALPQGAVVRFKDIESASSGLAPLGCSAAKVGPTRYLTAAHCVDAWNANFNAGVHISNHPTAPLDTRENEHTVVAVHSHPSWVIAQLAGDGFSLVGRYYDIALFDVEQTNSIPTLAVNGSPALYAPVVSTGLVSRLIGYGSGRKERGDNDAVNAPPAAFSVTHDPLVTRYTHFFWHDSPQSEPGDSGAPLLNHDGTRWRISGVVSGGLLAGYVKHGRTLPIGSWIQNPSPLALATGSRGYLINGRSPACLTQAGPTGNSLQWACYLPQADDGQRWTLQATSTANAFQLKRGTSANCLGTASSAKGAMAVIQPCSTSTNQRWEFRQRGAIDTELGNTAPGYVYYELRNVSTRFCLQPSGGSQTHGEFFVQSDCASSGSSPLKHPTSFVLVR
ncbi:MAG TPA: ricin-type beta-trefoil lectin domain protein [Polyangiaceae bacterium]